MNDNKKLTVYLDGVAYEANQIKIAVSDSESEKGIIEIYDSSAIFSDDGITIVKSLNINVENLTVKRIEMNEFRPLKLELENDAAN